MDKFVGDCSISILHKFLRIKYGYRNMRERVQVKTKPVSLIYRGYNVMMYVTCTSACYRVFTLDGRIQMQEAG